MKPSRRCSQDETRLRFVFNNRVVSVERATELSYWEIAEALDDLRERYGEPIAIDVVTGSGQKSPSASAWDRFRPTMA